jgi:Ca2+-binding RTX toxin-like protein
MNGANVSGSEELAAPATWTGGELGEWQVVAVNDYDGDTKADLFLRKSDGSNAIWKLDGTTVVSSTVVAGPTEKGPEWAVAGEPLAADVGTGDALPNRLIGDNGADVIRGLAGNDRLEGRGGDDTLVGGADNDTLIGGAGTDTAVFSGNRSAYTLSAGATLTVTSATEGTDTLIGIERLQFADVTISV